MLNFCRAGGSNRRKDIVENVLRSHIDVKCETLRSTCGVLSRTYLYVRRFVCPRRRKATQNGLLFQVSRRLVISSRVLFGIGNFFSIAIRLVLLPRRQQCGGAFNQPLSCVFKRCVFIMFSGGGTFHGSSLFYFLYPLGCCCCKIFLIRHQAMFRFPNCVGISRLL